MTPEPRYASQAHSKGLCGSRPDRRRGGVHVSVRLWSTVAALVLWPLLVQGGDELPILDVQCPATGIVFGLMDLRITPDGALAGVTAMPDAQVHDAYDADRDGAYVRLSASFHHSDGETVTVPGFAMRDREGGPWQWRVRWAPRRAGTWQVKVRLTGCESSGSAATGAQQTLLQTVSARPAAGITGPLVAPSEGHNHRYLRRLRADGSSESVWLFGACRAWVVHSQDPGNDWAPHEFLDRPAELFAPTREAGFNLLNQWMAPWEFLIVHHDRAEHWRDARGRWRRVPLPEEASWSPYQCYDQGRALAFDELVRDCEGGPGEPTIHLLLAPLPHQCLQLKEHPWGAQESGWSPENDGGKQTPERLNGFSGFRCPGGPEHGPEGMPVWEFFQADPSLPLDDWRARLFDHQANYYRYLIARWGYSRAIGAWVIVDELDAVGDVVGVMSEKKGWWGHPECGRWLADVIRLFRGELVRSDGMRYQGDPFRHPIHAATTSYGGQAARGANVDWEGGPAGCAARPVRLALVPVLERVAGVGGRVGLCHRRDIELLRGANRCRAAAGQRVRRA